MSSLTQYMGIYQDSSIFISHGRLKLVEPNGAIDRHSLAFHALYPIKRSVRFRRESKDRQVFIGTYCTGRATGLRSDHNPFTPILIQLLVETNRELDIMTCLLPRKFGERPDGPGYG